MIRPTSRFLGFMLLLFLPALLPSVWRQDAWTVWAGLTVTLVILFLIDLVLIARRSSFTIGLDAPVQMYIGEEAPATLRIEHHGRLRLAPLQIALDLGEDLAEVRPWTSEVPADGCVLKQVVLRPKRRGNHPIEALGWRWRGPLGLAEAFARKQLERTVLVVPNFGKVKDAAIRFMSNPEFLSGIKAERYLGEGSEFDRMREFHPGMDNRSIDWKASARHRRLLARQYRLERNHQVVISFDTGHLMAEPIHGMPRLDHAVNAGLLLAWCCLKAQDRVMVHAFDDRVRHFSDTHVGTHAMAQVQQATSRFDYGSAEANYTLAMTDLSVRLRRRSLIVVFTEFADSITARIMVDNLKRLARRHLVLFVTLRDAELEAYVESSPITMADVGRSVVSTGLLDERARVHRQLELAGVLCLDVKAEELSSALVSAYLDIKAKERI